jgi:preprotein translocase subunit SecG
MILWNNYLQAFSDFLNCQTTANFLVFMTIVVICWVIFMTIFLIVEYVNKKKGERK